MFSHKYGPVSPNHPWFTPLISAFMFSFLAWPRTIIFTLILSTLAEAREESLFTSSVTYCSPPETLLIQRFEVAYFPSNSSVAFNVSASSVESSVNVTANIFFNVYGTKPFNMTIDLCNILKGALCPLPMYNFTGADSLQLPSSLNIAQKIPNIAFRIPDLEGFAQLTLTEVHTGKVKACVQATLANGWSAHQEAVSWTTAILALLTLLAAGALSVFSPKAILPFRFLELIYLYQSIATSTLLNLNYPSIYRAFTLNFAWALGLISSADSSVQTAITRMRHLTGGKISDISAGDAVGFVNRNLSPYNNNVAAKARDVIYSVRATARETIKGEVQIVTSTSPTVLQAGVPIYVNLLGIATGNAFMTVFIITLCLLAISLVVVALGYAVVLVIRRRQIFRGAQPSEFDYLSFVISWYFRMALGLVTPLLIFIFYQWTLKDSWLAVFLSIVSLFVISIAIIYPSFRTYQLAGTDSASALFRPSHHLSRFSGLYAQYCQNRYWYFTPILSAVFLRSILIAFAKHSGPAQLAFMIIIESGLVLSHFVLKPSWSRASHVFSSYLAVTRFVCTIMMIAFLENLKVKAIPRVVIGIVIALIWSVSVVVVVVNIAWNIYLSIRQPLRSVTSPDMTTPSQSSMVEKGLGGSVSSQEKSQTASNSGNSSPGSFGHDDEGETQQASDSRPNNPTPDHNVPLDPAVFQPNTFSPTETTVSNSDPLTTSPSSRSTTYGSELPSRWSVHDSQPTSPLASSQEHSTGQGYRNSAASSSETGENQVGGTVSRNPSFRIHEDIQEENEDPPRPT